MEQAYNRNQAQNRDQSQFKINEGENTRDQAQIREETQNNDLPDKKKEKKVEDNEILSRQDMVETRRGMIKKFSKKLV